MHEGSRMSMCQAGWGTPLFKRVSQNRYTLPLHVGSQQTAPAIQMLATQTHAPHTEVAKHPLQPEYNAENDSVLRAAVKTSAA